MQGSRLWSVFLGGTLRVVVTVVILLALVVAGGLFTGVFGTPNVEDVQNRFGAVNESTTLIHTDLVIDNPNPIGVQLGDLTVDYAIHMNDIHMANGTKSGISLGTGESTIPFTTRMFNDRIPAWWASHLQNGEQTTLAVAADVTTPLVGMTVDVPPFEREITTDIESAFDTTATREIDANQPFIEDPILYLNETSGSWGDVTQDQTPIDLSFTVYNPKTFPIPLGELGYEIRMNGIQVGSGESSPSIAIPPQSTKTIMTTTHIDNSRLDEWWVSHLQRTQVTNLTIDIYARIDLSSFDAGTIEIPLDTVTHRFETDFFGTKNETTRNETPTDEPEEGTDEPGETATPSPTPHPSPTPTPTDDGLL